MDYLRDEELLARFHPESVVNGSLSGWGSVTSGVPMVLGLCSLTSSSVALTVGQ